MSDIEWRDSPTLAGARRGRQFIPAYDCGPGGRDCKHAKKGDHGQHCDDWMFVVARPGFAVSLEVFAGNFPRGQQGRPSGANLNIHSSKQLYEWDAKPIPGCRFIEAPCFTDGTSLGAQSFYETHGSGKYDETEWFWRALELEFERRFDGRE